MAYSPDLRKRVLDFIEDGGKKPKLPDALRLHVQPLIDGCTLKTLLQRKNQGRKKKRVIDEEALKKHVADFPDLTQKERAAHFGVSEFCIGYGLRKLGITQKKHSDINNAVMKNGQPIVKTSP